MGPAAVPGGDGAVEEAGGAGGAIFCRKRPRVREETASFRAKQPGAGAKMPSFARKKATARPGIAFFAAKKALFRRKMPVFGVKGRPFTREMPFLGEEGRAFGPKMPFFDEEEASFRRKVPFSRLPVPVSCPGSGFLGPEMGLPILSYMEAAVEFRAVTACAEFPNDNPALHRGAIWVWEEMSEVPRLVSPAGADPEPVVATPAEGAAAPEPVVASEPAVAPAVEPATDPTPPVLEADDPADDIEIVDDLGFEDTIDESPEPPHVPEMETQTTGSTDPFATFVAIVEDVARSAGGGDDAMATLAVFLGKARAGASTDGETHAVRAQALAWQGILRGESEDFDATGGGMLDDWAASLVARALGNAQRADGLKRELRRRGVAAFGLVEQAA